MTRREFEIEKKKLELRNTEILQKQELNKIKYQYRKPPQKISTSKLVLFCVFVVCIQILVFSEIAMMKYGDFTALYALIGVPVTLVPVVLGYFVKSGKENTKNGITYEMAMLDKQKEEEMESPTEINNGAVG